MKNKMQDVRNHLVAMMEALAEPEATVETINRAKALSELAQAYTNTVKVELEARRAAGIEDRLPEALESSAPPMRLVAGARQ